MSKRNWIAAVILAVTSLASAAEDPRWRAEGKHVLVVYAADDADGNGDGTPDSQDVAEYYALRRSVPKENLLGLKLKEPQAVKDWDYRSFHERILTPVAGKLGDKAPDGKPMSRHISYILLCPGVPYAMNTNHPAGKDEKSWFRKTRRRSVDSYLISVDENLKTGVDEKTGAPGAGADGPLGASQREVVLSFLRQYSVPQRTQHFRQLREERGLEYGYYLVSRLGLDLDSARNMIDGALYAERHLRLPAEGEKTPYRPAIWLDSKYGFAADHVAAMSRAIPLVQGVRGSPFAEGKGLRRVWPLVIDNQDPEVGKIVDGAQHKPTVSFKIAPNSVDAGGVTLAPPGNAGRSTDCPGVLYFPPGCTVACVPPPPPKPQSAPATAAASGATASASAPAAAPPASSASGPAEAPPTAKVVGIDLEKNRLLLSSTRGFQPGHMVKYVWPGEFPTDDCFYFYGFYGLGQYEDVFRFLPGSLGIHVDSACMTWARGAMSRGMAATFGVTAEPLSIGIPYGQSALHALAEGYDWAEAAYSSLVLAQRWTGVLFGDPVYAPFRSRQVADKAPPVLGKPAASSAAGKVAIAVSLEGKSEDELADVALFRLEYAQAGGKPVIVDYFDWPEPTDSKLRKDRRSGYSRHARWSLAGLDKGREVRYRIVARDPAGLESAPVEGTVTP